MRLTPAEIAFAAFRRRKLARPSQPIRAPPLVGSTAFFHAAPLRYRDPAPVRNVGITYAGRCRSVPSVRKNARPPSAGQI